MRESLKSEDFIPNWIQVFPFDPGLQFVFLVGEK